MNHYIKNIKIHLYSLLVLINTFIFGKVWQSVIIVDVRL